MKLPFKKPDNINLDTDDKGLFLYIGFNLMTGLFIILLMLIALNSVLLGVIFLIFFIPTMFKYFEYLILYLYTFISQLALYVLCYGTYILINKNAKNNNGRHVRR